MCPISFVKDVLVRSTRSYLPSVAVPHLTSPPLQFPYALRTLPAILSTKWSDPSFLPYRDAFPEQARRSPAAFEAHVRDLTDRDVKVAYLKNLHGHLWQTGYETAAYSTPLFEDVPAAFARWARQGKEIAIYSSGSVFAQTLLFKHVELGGRSAREEDERAPPPPEAERLCAMISAWFDTTNAGPKTDLGSYQRIAAALGRQPGRILFLSDAAKGERSSPDGTSFAPAERSSC